MTNDPDWNLRRWFRLVEDADVTPDTRRVLTEQLTFFAEAVKGEDENMMFAAVQTLTEAALSAGLMVLAEDATATYADVTTDPIHRAFSHTNIATWRFSVGDTEGAERALEVAQLIFAQHRHSDGLSRTLTIVGDIQRSRGLPHDATLTYRAARARAESDSRRVSITARLVESTLDEFDIDALKKAVDEWLRLTLVAGSGEPLRQVVIRVAEIGRFLARSGIALGPELHALAVQYCHEYGFDPLSTCGSLDGT